jgi:hypothetical protein
MSSSFSRRQRARPKRGRTVAYQLSFITGFDLFGGEMDGASDAAQAVGSVLSRLASGAPRPWCVTCDHEFRRGSDLPALIMVAKPWSSAGPLLTGGICANCARQGHDVMIAKCLAAFREGGLRDVRVAQTGAA